MVIVIGRVLIRSGCLPQALALSREHVARSRGEPGCIAHAVHHDSENARHLVFVEQWADRAALAAHFRLPASRAFVDAVSALASERPTIESYEASAVPV